MASIHVDDMLITGSDKFQRVLADIGSRLRFRTFRDTDQTGTLEYRGATIRRSAQGGYELSFANYLAQVRPLTFRADAQDDRPRQLQKSGGFAGCLAPRSGRRPKDAHTCLAACPCCRAACRSSSFGSCRRPGRETEATRHLIVRVQLRGGRSTPGSCCVPRA